MPSIFIPESNRTKHALYPRHVYDRYESKLETWMFALLLVNTCLATGERYVKDKFIAEPCDRPWKRRDEGLGTEKYVEPDVVNKLVEKVRQAKRAFRKLEATIPSSQIDKGEARKVCHCGSSCVFQSSAFRSKYI